MKSAVCLLLSASPTEFLGISRRNDTTRWGLPGGKVDPGETNIEALVREVSEEVGLQLNPLDLEPLFSDVCHGKGPEDTYWVTTYLWRGTTPPLEFMQAEEGMALSWLQEASLCDPAVSPFADYNVGVFKAFRAFQG
jgi:8-oxo-dGTP diphosphatase